MNVLVCSSCCGEYDRPLSLVTSTFAQCRFVCENCRCKDCSIVLEFECECGDRHAERSSEDPQVCTECQRIRRRVANLDPELLKLRSDDIAGQESLYGMPCDSVSRDWDLGDTVN